jgi:hypothetical protein
MVIWSFCVMVYFRRTLGSGGGYHGFPRGGGFGSIGGNFSDAEDRGMVG